jgi:nuclear pore complex protein Nup107
VQLAQTLINMLPPELAAIECPEEISTEYLHYRQFFIIWDALAKVVDCQALDMPGMNREARAAWLKDYRVKPSQNSDCLDADCNLVFFFLI